MLKKARQKNLGNHRTILWRWYARESYRDPLIDIGWKEKDTMQFDRIALEKHVYVATKAEKIQNSKHWTHVKCRRTSAATQSTTRLCSSEKRMQTIARRALGKDSARLQNHPSAVNKFDKEQNKQLEGTEELDYAVAPKTGWRFYKESRGNLPTASSSSSNWDQTQRKTSNWNSQHSSRSDDLRFFSELGPVSVAWRKTSRQPTGSVNSTPTKNSTYRVAQHDHISSREHAWLKLEGLGLHIFTHFNLSFRRSLQNAHDLWHTMKSGGSTQIPSLTFRCFPRLAVVLPFSVHN